MCGPGQYTLPPPYSFQLNGLCREFFGPHRLQICDSVQFARHGQKGRRGDYPNCQEDGQNGAEEKRGEMPEKEKCLAPSVASRLGSREFTAKLGANGL